MRARQEAIQWQGSSLCRLKSWCLHLKMLSPGIMCKVEPMCPVSPATRTTTWQFSWQSWARLCASLPQELRLPASVCWQVTWPWQGHSRALGLNVLWILAWLNSMARWWMCLARIYTLKLGTVEAFQLWTAPVTWAKRRGSRACLGIAQVSGLSWALVLCRVVEACAAAPSRCFMPQRMEEPATRWTERERNVAMSSFARWIVSWRIGRQMWMAAANFATTAPSRKAVQSRKSPNMVAVVRSHLQRWESGWFRAMQIRVLWVWSRI